MNDCENCKELQEKLDTLQEKYDELYKSIDDAVFELRRDIDNLAKEL